jgi:hypothetical protein
MQKICFLESLREEVRVRDNLENIQSQSQETFSVGVTEKLVIQSNLTI